MEKSGYQTLNKKAFFQEKHILRKENIKYIVLMMDGIMLMYIYHL